MSEREVPGELDPQDAKLVTLARGARGRVGAVEGAAVRDTTGRTYSGASVALAHLQVSALALAVAQAAASGATGLEAAALVTGQDTLADSDVAAVRDLGGPGVPVLRVGTDGGLRARTTT